MVEHKNKPDNGAALSTHDSSHEGLHVPEVTWYKHSGLRRLYSMMPILFLGATINGYDGSLLNGLQTMIPWQECKRRVNPLPSRY